MKGLTISLAILGLGTTIFAKSELKITEITTPDYCYTKARKGDVAYILHEGYFQKKMIDTNPEGPDGELEPLRIALGKGHVLQGMEQAIIGMCVGQTVEARIPPHLAYDDKSKNFQHKPVPNRAVVNYKITLTALEHPGSISYTISNMVKDPVSALPVFIMLSVVGLLAYWMNKKGEKIGKAKKNKKKQ